ncbi:GNAT family N-acetyltransferase [Aquincola sp. S2]|uniref:GNAT family N-acetyltransferase n=1 Tax=Pseudaquabacterium terrae TaxID=2732868 RepID=A0ABX2EA83_9BURK|nr:GNAT family N-acetyltransferase [Aquabacterium terrae]NRF65738.1 GNAT family N-acetyltransferase [Aquabacterium terrae]
MILDNLTLRPATHADALCIGVLATQVFLDTYATEGIRPALAREVLQTMSPQAFAPLLLDPSIGFILAELNAHLVGFAQLQLPALRDDVPSRRAAELQRLYVQARFASVGVGTRLLRAAEAEAAALGADTLWLTAWSGNQRARAFYARRGYADIGATSHHFEQESFENRLFVRALGSTAA